MKILLGGVPFGCDNIGDEAILECVVRIVRELRPDAEIGVCTHDPEHTASKLSVATHIAYGFARVPVAGFDHIVGAYDVFIWCGATGLSDYPEAAMSLLRIAREHDVKTIVWGVGMNSELNPKHFSLGTGRLRSVLGAVRACTLGLWDAVAWEEARREARGRRRVAHGLSRAELVVLRDPESRQEVLRCGVTRDVHVGADSALVLEPADRQSLPLAAAVTSLLASPKKKVCICISAQREIGARKELVRYLDDVVRQLDADIFFLPMNPITDAELMGGLAAEMVHRERTVLVEGLVEPGEVLTFLPDMDVVVSSRLHLLILASIVHVPIVGISRGSKVDNFLRPYGLEASGSVDDCNFDVLLRETGRLLDGRDEFAQRSRQVRANLLARLEAAKVLLGNVLSSETSLSR